MKEKDHNEIDFKSLEKNTGRKISENMIQEILRLDVNDIKKLQKETRSFLEALYENGIVQEKSIIKYNSPYDEKIKELPELRKQVVETFASPNYIYDEGKN